VSADLVERTLLLCRALRDEGLPVTTSNAMDAVRALRIVGLDSRRQVHLALRCVLAAQPEHFEIFDDLFAQHFGADAQVAGGLVRVRRRPEKGAAAAPSLSSWAGQGAAGEDGAEDVPGASDQAALSKKDFSTFAADDLDEIQRIAARIARRLAARPSRRWKAARRGARVDLRGTMRRSLVSSGELLPLRRRRRKPRKTRIVALCDVSGSMDLYSRLLLQFLYALQGSVARVESFAFSTDLRRITDLLGERDYADALRGLSAGVQGWSGGTRIGECLAAFNAGWGHLVDRRTVVVILSDGWDTGDPALLAAEMEALELRSRRLIWLNPLLGSEGYEPLTQGMQAALPHIDVFAPAHNLDALRALERHLLA
jgi:uncharacterized protein with von Willebrand factor type A (vWA) domain